ncbi:MAG: hypothetical protein JNM78_18835 [Cyclobacteriaceae bacterium]|nr:hypothetical protein [Cyclobacteriaceae bacterium]
MSELETIFHEEIYSIPSPLLIILAKPWEELLEAELDTLSRMLKAIKLSLASVRIIVRKEFDVNELSALAATRVLAFGTSCSTPFTQYENINSDGISIIISESLDQLDDQKKKSLWIALKGMFSL